MRPDTLLTGVNDDDDDNDSRHGRKKQTGNDPVCVLACAHTVITISVSERPARVER